MEHDSLSHLSKPESIIPRYLFDPSLEVFYNKLIKQVFRRKKFELAYFYQHIQMRGELGSSEIL